MRGMELPRSLSPRSADKKAEAQSWGFLAAIGTIIFVGTPRAEGAAVFDHQANLLLLQIPGQLHSILI